MASLLNDKPNAMRRFQRKLNLENIFHLFNVAAAILLFSHSFSFPITLQTLSHLHHTLIPLFHNSFYAFLLLNAIILFLFALSNNKNKDNNNNNNNNNNNVAACTDVYDQILNHTESRHVVTAPQEQPRTAEKESEETVTAVTETAAACCCTTLSTVTEGEAISVSEKKPYRRVQSESYERRMVVAAARGELKRWETVGLRRPFESELRCVEELSEEEFNRAVEEFIALHKRMQWEEQLAQNLACTPSN